jgi:hypothetical protein
MTDDDESRFIATMIVFGVIIFTFALALVYLP